MKVRLLTVGLRFEDDVVTARQRARQVAALLGFDGQDQTRIATAVSEIARNAVTYGTGGRAEFSVDGSTAPQLLVIDVIDKGRGITNLDAVLGGTYKSETGMGLGIVGAKRLMDGFDINTSARGTAITLQKVFPRFSPFWSEKRLAGLAASIESEIRARPTSLLDELKQQNHELVAALEQLETKQKELTRLNAELFDTNRGVLALYAELDEKADHLRRADDLKTRFLSNMSHEFRTPLNSILALSRLLTDRVDGPLSEAQEKQVVYIRKSATELLELVSDLLDLAKVGAGKITVRPGDFSVENLFSALRGMLRPLLVSTVVNLVFEDASGVPEIYGDEAKVGQILRNFLSNALKFTERGEIRVTASLLLRGESLPNGRGALEEDTVLLCVADTGIGIAPDDVERIFEEFTQVEGPLQKNVRGTGLGLPLSRKLATMLGGQAWVDSELGVGSRFYLAVPRAYAGTVDADEVQVPEPVVPGASGLPVLVIEDRVEDRAVLEGILASSPFRVVAADRLPAAQSLLATAAPVAVVLDIVLHGEDSWRFLPEVKRAGLPVVVVSTIDDRRKGFALGADAYCVKPVERAWLLDTLYRLVLAPRLRRILIVDDDRSLREQARALLRPYCDEIREAADGQEAVRLARAHPPDLMLLDLVMPVMSGFDVLRELRAGGDQPDLTIVVCTSKALGTGELAELAELGAAVLPKSELHRDALLAAVLAAMVKPAREAAVAGSVEHEVRRAI